MQLKANLFEGKKNIEIFNAAFTLAMFLKTKSAKVNAKDWLALMSIVNIHGTLQLNSAFKHRYRRPFKSAFVKENFSWLQRNL